MLAPITARSSRLSARSYGVALTPQEAVIRSVSRVGEFDHVLIAALVSLAPGQFAFYQSLGPALAIGIALMLDSASRRRPPARHLRRAVFWPTCLGAQQSTPGWRCPRDGRASRSSPGSRRRCRLRRCQLEPSGTDSAAGSALIQTDFPSSNTGRQPRAGVTARPTPVWNDPSALARAQHVRVLRSSSARWQSERIPLTTDQLTQLHTALGPARELPPVATTTAVPERSTTPIARPGAS